MGLTITEDLRWSSHISHITATALKRLFFIRRRLRLAPIDTKLLAYNTFVRPILEYGNIVWFPFTKQDIAKLEGVQRKAIRFIFNKYGPHESPTVLMETAGIDTLQRRARIARLKFMYLIVHNKVNIDATNFITSLQTRPTRHNHTQMLTEYTFHTDCFKNSFFPLTIREWNNLPLHIIESTSLTQFLTALESVP